MPEHTHHTIVLASDQSSELAQALKCSQMELTDSHSKCSQLQSQLDAANHVAEEVGTLRHELTGKNQRIEELQKHCVLIMVLYCYTNNKYLCVQWRVSVVLLRLRKTRG